MPTFVHYIPIATTDPRGLLRADRLQAAGSERKPAPHLFWWSRRDRGLRAWEPSPKASPRSSGGTSSCSAAGISPARCSAVRTPRPGHRVPHVLAQDREPHGRRGGVPRSSREPRSSSCRPSTTQRSSRTDSPGRSWSGDRLGLFSPFINTYAAIFLIGGAVAVRLAVLEGSRGAGTASSGTASSRSARLLPGIGGTATRFGYTEVLYVMEFLGIILIWIGYRYNVRPGARGAPKVVPEASATAS